MNAYWTPFDSNPFDTLIVKGRLHSFFSQTTQSVAANPYKRPSPFDEISLGTTTGHDALDALGAWDGDVEPISPRTPPKAETRLGTPDAACHGATREAVLCAYAGMDTTTIEDMELFVRIYLELRHKKTHVSRSAMVQRMRYYNMDYEVGRGRKSKRMPDVLFKLALRKQGLFESYTINGAEFIAMKGLVMDRTPPLPKPRRGRGVACESTNAYV